MKRAIIIFNGDLANFDTLKFTTDDFIICADGAVEKILKRNIYPSVVIGDFDSTSKKTIKKLKEKKIEIIKYPGEKDKTDSELAIEYAIKKKYKRITLCGLLGTRVDHLLANILLLGKYIGGGCDITIIEHNTIMYTVRKKQVIIGKKNDIVSLLPITKKVTGITTSGLYYVLKNATLKFGSTRGVSNYMTESRAMITIQKGVLLVALPFFLVPSKK